MVTWLTGEKKMHVQRSDVFGDCTITEQAITAKEAIARESSVVLLSDSQTNAANVVAEAMTIVNRLNAVQGKTDGTS